MSIEHQGGGRLQQLLLAGLIIGALLPAGFLIVLDNLFLPTPNTDRIDALVGCLIVAAYGAPIGAVFSSFLGATVLRHVPVQRAVAWSLMALIAGLVAGMAFGRYWLDGAAGFSAIAGAGITLLASCLILWWKHRAPHT